MKKLHRSLLMILLLPCLLLGACGESSLQTSDTTTSTDITQTSATTENSSNVTPEPIDSGLYINGVDISNYTIIYAQSPLEKTYGSQTGKTVGEDIGTLLLGENTAYDFDYQSAMRLQELILNRFGVTLPIKKDVDTKESDCELLVGQTNRQSSRKMTLLNKNKFPTLESFTDTTSFVCMQSASKPSQYVICGGVYGATWHAIDKIEDYFRANEGSEHIDLIDAGDLSGTYDMKNVACIGDSVLRGSQAICDGDYADADSLSTRFGSSATSHYIEKYLSYPAALQRALWKDYNVFNYGRGYASMRDYFPGEKDKGPYYYRDSTPFKNCLSQAKKEGFAFDLLVIQLGGNDSAKVGTSWTDEQKKSFLEEARALIDAIRAYSPNLKTVFMNVPHRAVASTNKVSQRANAMREVQKETVKALLDEGYDVYLFDLYSMMRDNLTTNIDRENVNDTTEKLIHKEYYNFNSDSGKDDYTHPNYRGYAKIAEHVKPLLEYLLDGKPAPIYMIDVQ